MPPQTPDSRQLGKFMALGQVGIEMVAPIVLGLVLDHAFGWLPWATVIGAVLGLVGGIAHLFALAKGSNGQDQEPPP